MSETVVGLVQMEAPFSLDEMAEMIRRIVREEVSTILEERGFYAEPTIIEPGSPVSEDFENGRGRLPAYPYPRGGIR